MVPLSEGPTVATIRAGLLGACAAGGDAVCQVAAQRAWVLGDIDALPGMAVAAAESMGLPAERSARHVAVLGYAAAADRLDPALLGALNDGIRWLAARQWNRPYRAATLEADGVSMVGMALGARHVADAGDATRLGSLAVTCAGSASLSPFNHSMMVAAAHVLVAPGRPDLSTMLPEARVALAAIGILPWDASCQRDAWRNAMRFVPADDGPSHAAVTLRAFDALCDVNMPARLGRLEVEDVVRVLQGIVRSLRGWTWEDRSRTRNSDAVRWDIQNEYQVQNLLWFALAPLFPDLNAEEYTPPVGQKTPRMDLTIPSLRLVIEVKFVRPGARFSDIVEEIAADVSLYGTDPRWDALIPFVWDDSRRTEEHATLIDGLGRMGMVRGTVVISRPGKMARRDEMEPASPVDET